MLPVQKNKQTRTKVMHEPYAISSEAKLMRNDQFMGEQLRCLPILIPLPGQITRQLIKANMLETNF